MESRGVKELSETRMAERAQDTCWPRLSRLGMARTGTMDEKSQETIEELG